MSTTQTQSAAAYYIIKAANHDEKFGPDYPFTRYPDRERAGRVAAKMAERTGVQMTVLYIEKRMGVEIQMPDGTYGPPSKPAESVAYEATEAEHTLGEV